MAVAVATTGGRASDVCAVYIYYICTIEAKNEWNEKNFERGTRGVLLATQLNTMPYWELSECLEKLLKKNYCYPKEKNQLI